MISYDQFQSLESMQSLEKAGFPVKYQSVDKTDEAENVIPGEKVEYQPESG